MILKNHPPPPAPEPHRKTLPTGLQYPHPRFPEPPTTSKTPLVINGTPIPSSTETGQTDKNYNERE